MSKQEIINRIRRLNNSADGEFLASFNEDELLAYLHQLQEVEHKHQQIKETELVYGNS